MDDPILIPAEDVRICRQHGVAPRVAVVAGSGLGGLAELVDDAFAVPYADLPGFPRPSYAVPGHAGRLVSGTVGEVPVVVFQGRVHTYQGVSARDAAYVARLAAGLGAQTLVVTNAAGGVREDLSAGDIVLISDQINLTADSPLAGWPGPAGGAPFVPMRDAYDPELRSKARIAALENGIPLAEGVYAGLRGPAFETPAEVEYLRAIGADTVGMSTVHEVVAARALGMRVLGFTLVTNAAAGVGLSHDEVLAAGVAAGERLTSLMLAILRGL